MREILKSAVLMSGIISGFGCAQKEIRAVSPREKSLYETGIKLHSDGAFKKSEESLTLLLKEFPVTRWLSSSYYVLGLDQEAQGNFPDAIENFRRVVDFYQGIHTRDEAEALYHMALSYDGLGDTPRNDERQVLTLLQLQPGLKYLSLEISQAEWPARLAAAYAREGLTEQAKEYSLIAEKGLRRVKASGKPNVQKWLPKTYYSMGHIPEAQLHFKTTSEITQFFILLDNSQGWLLLAAQSNATPWSVKASTELKDSYQKIWEFIDKLPALNEADPILSAKQQQENQRALASRLDTLLQNLKILRSPSIPEVPEDANVTDLFAFLQDVQKRVDILIGTRDVQDQNLMKKAKSKRPKK